jgi:CBS domain-containing protein
MQARNIMKRNFEVTAPDVTVRAAAIKMRDTATGLIPVCNGPQFAGILTDRDIAVRLAAEGYDANRTLVGEIMTRDLTYCFEDQSIDEAAFVMQFHRISSLPVLDRAHRLVGIIDLSDIAASLEASLNKLAAPVPKVETGETAPALAAAGSQQ